MVERSTLLDRTYNALAHPTRRAMLELLTGGSLRVTDLAEPFNVSLAAVSKHIGVLESADLVTRTVEGRDHRLSLNTDPLLGAREWIDDCRDFWERRLAALDSHLRDTQ